MEGEYSNDYEVRNIFINRCSYKRDVLLVLLGWIVLHCTARITNIWINNATPKNVYIIPYPTAFPYGNGMVLHFYQQQESSTTKTVNKVINKGLKTYV